MDANQNLTAEMIKIDPYNYTLSEMVDVIGETEAKKLFLMVATQENMRSNYVTIIALKLFVFKEEPVLQCV